MRINQCVGIWRKNKRSFLDLLSIAERMFNVKQGCGVIEKAVPYLRGIIKNTLKAFNFECGDIECEDFECEELELEDFECEDDEMSDQQSEGFVDKYRECNPYESRGCEFTPYKQSCVQPCNPYESMKCECVTCEFSRRKNEYCQNKPCEFTPYKSSGVQPLNFTQCNNKPSGVQPCNFTQCNNKPNGVQPFNFAQCDDKLYNVPPTVPIGQYTPLKPCPDYQPLNLSQYDIKQFNFRPCGGVPLEKKNLSIDEHIANVMDLVSVVLGFTHVVQIIRDRENYKNTWIYMYFVTYIYAVYNLLSKSEKLFSYFKRVFGTNLIDLFKMDPSQLIFILSTICSYAKTLKIEGMDISKLDSVLNLLKSFNPADINGSLFSILYEFISLNNNTKATSDLRDSFKNVSQTTSPSVKPTYVDGISPESEGIRVYKKEEESNRDGGCDKNTDSANCFNDEAIKKLLAESLLDLAKSYDEENGERVDVDSLTPEKAKDICKELCGKLDIDVTNFDTNNILNLTNLNPPNQIVANLVRVLHYMMVNNVTF